MTALDDTSSKLELYGVHDYSARYSYCYGDWPLTWAGLVDHLTWLRGLGHTCMDITAPVWITESGNLGAQTLAHAMGTITPLQAWLDEQGIALGVSAVFWFIGYVAEGSYWDTQAPGTILYQASNALTTTGEAWKAMANILDGRPTS